MGSAGLPEGVTIRVALPDDAATLARMRCRMFQAMGEPEEGSSEVERATAAYFARTLPTRDVLGQIAEANGQAIGCAAAVVIQAPPVSWHLGGLGARVQTVFVDEQWRRRGIAAALLEALLDGLEHRGVGVVLLRATEEGRALYESFGFEENPEMALSIADWRRDHPLQ